MHVFFEEHQVLLEALLQQHVDFMLVGGYAVNYYGYHRVTGDMDIWLKPDNSNKERLLAALASIGFDDHGIETIRHWDFTQPQKFHIGRDEQPDKTEFMTHISGVAYTEAEENQVMAEMGGIRIPMIHYHNLIENKKASARLQDLADVEHLEKIRKFRNEEH